MTIWQSCEARAAAAERPRGDPRGAEGRPRAKLPLDHEVDRLDGEKQELEGELIAISEEYDLRVQILKDKARCVPPARDGPRARSGAVHC